MLFPRRIAGVVFTFAALAWLVPGALAQQPIDGAEGERSLDAKELKGDERNTFNKLKEGNIEYSKEYKPILEKAAQWFVYRVTWPQYQRKSLPDATDRQTVHDIVSECNRQLLDRSKLHSKEATREKQLLFLQEYTREVIKAIDDVLKNPMAIARVNAARILAHLGKTGPEEVGDYMVKVLKDKEQLDAVKLYALRGLKELFIGVYSQPEPKDRKFKSAIREAQLVQAVVEFLHREPNFPKNTPADEIEGFRYVRREAVRALAALRSPLIVQKKAVFAKPALELLRVMAKEGYTPESSISERIDAALGFLQMQGKGYPTYQPEHAGPVLGQFVIDFALAYDDDRKNKGPERREAWMVLAVRVQQGCENWKTECKDTAYAKGLTEQINLVLRAVEKDQVASVERLRDFLKKSKPTSTSLYKDDDKSMVEPPAPPEANN
jgi:hypothetical protein